MSGITAVSFFNGTAIARKLGELNDEVVYLGGCTTALFINDPLSLDVRPTLHVDCIIDVISLGQYYKFEDNLKEKGFHCSPKWERSHKCTAGGC